MAGRPRGKIVLLATSPRMPAGLLSGPAWDALRSAPVLCGRADHPQIPALAASGVHVTVLPGPAPDGPMPDVTALDVTALAGRAAAEPGGTIVWLLEPGGSAENTAAIGSLIEAFAAVEPAVEIVAVTGSFDPPGARLLDAVAVMDRLRSPGGCPWDAEQTHVSLAKHLIEEAYEAYEAIEDGDGTGLREELGDVLMQIVFHARLAQEPGGYGWDVDDVAGDLVDKLVRRHPHVFGDVTVAGADEVVTNWDAIKAAEKGRRSVTEGVPLSQPALSLAATLHKRASTIGVPADLLPGGAAPAALIGSLSATEGPLDTRALGDLLLAAVALARVSGVDPETALRAAARRFRDDLATAENAARDAGGDPATTGSATWRELWP